MSIRPMHLIRYGLVLLGTTAIVGCSSEDNAVTEPGSISLSLSQGSLTVEQGGSQTVTATLTRIGGFSGAVNLTVTGAPSGVTATVSNVQTSGAVTTFLVTILAGVAVPAEYQLMVHANGSGVAEVTQAFTLTVPASLPALGFSIYLSAAALSIVQGASTPTTTVNITRFGQVGGVGLYVTGLPTGVTASFDPTSWPAEFSTVLTLTVAAAAVPGIYNLQVNAYDPEQEGEVSTPLTLTVTTPPPAPGYALSLSASALSVAQGALSPITTLNLGRTNFTGNVELSVENLPTSVSAQFRPENVPMPGSPPAMWLLVAGDALPGTYPNLVVRGVASGLSDRTARLTLTIGVAPFALTLLSPTLSIAQGATTPTTVNIVRNDFAGPVTLHVGWYNEDHDVLPPGVTAAFAPNPATGNSAVLTITVGAAATPGVHSLFVFAGASTAAFCCIPLTLTVTAP